MAFTDTVREYDYDRYICSLFAGEKQREALHILYAFNLEIARIYEAVNEPMAGLARLAWWGGEIEKIYDGGVRTNHELLTSISQIIAEYNLSKEQLLGLINSHEHDFDEQPPTHIGQLEEYVLGTSSALLLLASEILGGGAEEQVNHIGIAWGVTGLLRSAYVHIPKSRMTIFPQTLLDEAGISKDIYGGDKFLINSKDIVEKLVGFARFHVECARGAKIGKKNRKNNIAILLLGTLAEGYLKQIEKNKYDIFTHKYERVSYLTMLLLYLKAARGKF